MGFILIARAYDSTKALLQGTLLLRLQRNHLLAKKDSRWGTRCSPEVERRMQPNLRARNLSSACAYKSQLSVFWML